VVGQRLVEVVAEIPAVSKVEAGGLDELAFRADALEEHGQLEFEEDHRVNRGTAAGGVAIGDPYPNDAKIQSRIKVAIEVISRAELLKRDGPRSVEATEPGRSEH
jgi:hypothetical protein